MRPASSSPITPTKDASRAERRDIARHVAGAADQHLLAPDRDTGAGASGEMRATSP